MIKMGIKETDTLELLDRFDYLAQKYIPLAAELAPKIEKFGKYKRELEFIVVELQIRGVQPKDNEELKHIIESLLVGETVYESQPNSTEGHRESGKDPVPDNQ